MSYNISLWILFVESTVLYFLRDKLLFCRLQMLLYGSGSFVRGWLQLLFVRRLSPGQYLLLQEASSARWELPARLLILFLHLQLPFHPDWSAPDLWSSFKVSPNRFYEAFRFSSDTSITFQTDLRNASVISISSNV